jgi:hypothetical protein
MYCPHCGQERISDSTRFCSRCGYLLTGTAELMKTGGALPTEGADAQSPRSRGIRQGLFIFLLVFLVAPILGMISVFALRIPPWPMGIAVFLLGVGGLLRIVYAMMFESNVPSFNSAPNELNSGPDLATSALPPMRDVPAADYVKPNLFDSPVTSDRPPSVTESTTRLLEKDPEN